MRTFDPARKELRLAGRIFNDQRQRYTDGKWVITSNDDTLTAEDLALGYKQLLRVEVCWRQLKSGLHMRPVRHFRPWRIQAHVTLAVFALLLERIIDSKLVVSDGRKNKVGDDPAFKKLADDAIVALFKSGEINKIYSRWFESPFPPRNVNLLMPMNNEMKRLIRNPNSDGAEACGRMQCAIGLPHNL